MLSDDEDLATTAANFYISKSGEQGAHGKSRIYLTRMKQKKTTEKQREITCKFMHNDGAISPGELGPEVGVTLYQPTLPAYIFSSTEISRGLSTGAFLSRHHP